MLKTPLGYIEVAVDNIPIPYRAKQIECDKSCTDLNGRYSVQIEYVPDGNQHEIVCSIKDYKPTLKDGIESGERLELKSFYKNSVKLSIGMEGDYGYYSDGSRISDYDYDNKYIENGVKYVLLSITKTSVYTFGIAWIDEVTEINDVQTWFGADPTLMR